MAGETAPISQGRLLHKKNFFALHCFATVFELSCSSISISKIKLAESGLQGSFTVFWERRVAPPNPTVLRRGRPRQEGFGRRRGTPISVWLADWELSFNI